MPNDTFHCQPLAYLDSYLHEEGQWKISANWLREFLKKTQTSGKKLKWYLIMLRNPLNKAIKKVFQICK